MNWGESDHVVDQMIKGSTGELWGVTLEKTDHFPLLSHVLEIVGNENSLIDIGCGAGDVSRVWKGEYVGVDFDWVIERVAKICNPNSNYVSLDLNVDSVKKLPKAKVALMNAFLDVREDPHEMFEQVMGLEIDSLVVHRQRLSQSSCVIDKRPGYGGTSVPSSVMSVDRIMSFTEKFAPNATISLFHWQQDFYTFIVRK